jgi:hypothetical protein
MAVQGKDARKIAEGRGGFKFNDDKRVSLTLIFVSWVKCLNGEVLIRSSAQIVQIEQITEENLVSHIQGKSCYCLIGRPS